MKHLIETTDPSGLTFEEYDRIVLDSTTDEIIVKEGVTYEVIPDQYIYNKTDNKYYQKIVAYGNSNRIDLNSEWISNSEDDEYTYFKSYSNVGVDNSYSQCKVTWSNLTSVTFKYMSDSDSIYDDYLCVGYLDSEKFTEKPDYYYSNVYLSTQSKEAGTYNEFTIECDKGEHHIWFCYRKDNTGSSGKDRGFIGVPKSVVSVLDVKQGSELSTEYKFGGVSAEGGKTYDISFNNVILPNDNIVPVYEDFQKVEKTINYEYVNLGLESGTLWAKCNIGASSETERGIYFMWGEISGVNKFLLGKYPQKRCLWANYKYCGGTQDTMTKYCTNNNFGTVDNIEILESVDDAATQIMGSDWRMPTVTEYQELINNTKHEWVTNYNSTGVAGIKLTSTINGKSIFFPAVGYCGGLSVTDDIDVPIGYVWSSSLHGSNSSYGQDFQFASRQCITNTGDRDRGHVVRGVRK